MCKSITEHTNKEHFHDDNIKDKEIKVINCSLLINFSLKSLHVCVYSVGQWDKKILQLERQGSNLSIVVFFIKCEAVIRLKNSGMLL